MTFSERPVSIIKVMVLALNKEVRFFGVCAFSTPLSIVYILVYFTVCPLFTRVSSTLWTLSKLQRSLLKTLSFHKLTLSLKQGDSVLRQH